jgi:hypothetical protein
VTNECGVYAGVRGLERIFRGQLTRSRLRKYILVLPHQAIAIYINLINITFTSDCKNILTQTPQRTPGVYACDVLGMTAFFDNICRVEKNRLEGRRMSINIEIVNRICCGTTCLSSEEYILGTTSLNSLGSPLRQLTRTERKSKTGPASMLPPHKKVRGTIHHTTCCLQTA